MLKSGAFIAQKSKSRCFLIVLRKNAKKWTFSKIDPGCIPFQLPLNFTEFGAPDIWLLGVTVQEHLLYQVLFV